MLAAHWSRFGIAAWTVLGLCACQSPPPPNYPVLPDFVERPAMPGFTFIDARPQQDRVTQGASPWITSCDFGVVRLGDEWTVPSKMTLLRRDLEDAFGNRLAGVTLTVTRYRMFRNQYVQMHQAATSGLPPLGAAIGEALLTPSGCPDGAYKASEVTLPGPPFIVEIAVTFEGREIAVRTVHSMPPVGQEPALMPGEASPMFVIIREADAALVEQLRHALDAQPPR